MTAKFLMLVLIIGLANTCVVQAQVAAPAQLPAVSPSPAKKHRQPKSASFSALTLVRIRTPKFVIILVAL
jgi:hypothetical protein